MRLINGIWFHESVKLLEAGSVQVFGIDLEELTNSAQMVSLVPLSRCLSSFTWLTGQKSHSPAFIAMSVVRIVSQFGR